MLGLLRKLFDSNTKELKRLQEQVEIINSWEPKMQLLSDGELQAKTGEFKERLSRGRLWRIFCRRPCCCKRLLGGR